MSSLFCENQGLVTQLDTVRKLDWAQQRSSSVEQEVMAVEQVRWGHVQRLSKKNRFLELFFSQGRLCRKCLATTETPSTSDLYLIFLQAVRKWSSEVGRSSEIKFKFTGEHSPLQISPVLKRWLIVMSQRQVPSSLFPKIFLLRTIFSSQLKHDFMIMTMTLIPST